MKPSGWECRRCGEELLHYNIGFDDGYQCPNCKVIFEKHEVYTQDTDNKVVAALEKLKAMTPRCPVNQELLDQQQKLLHGASCTPRQLSGIGGWRWFELEALLPELGITHTELWMYYASRRNDIVYKQTPSEN